MEKCKRLAAIFFHASGNVELWYFQLNASSISFFSSDFFNRFLMHFCGKLVINEMRKALMKLDKKNNFNEKSIRTQSDL